MSNKYTIENSLTHSLIQKTSHNIQNVRIYIEKQFFTHCQLEFAAHLYVEQIFNFVKIAISIKRFNNYSINNMKQRFFTIIKSKFL